MAEEYIPDYKRYTSENLIDLYLRFDKDHNPKKYEALIQEIKNRFNIQGEIDLSNHEIGASIISKIKQEDPERIYNIDTGDKKPGFLIINLGRIAAFIFIIFLIYTLGFQQQDKPMVVLMLVIASLANLAYLIHTYTTGKTDKEKDEPGQNGKSNKLLLDRIIGFVLFAIYLAAAALFQFNIITF